MKLKIIVLVSLLPFLTSCDSLKGDKGDTGPLGPGANITTYTGTIPDVPDGDPYLDFNISVPVITANSIVSVISSSDTVHWSGVSTIARDLDAKTITCMAIQGGNEGHTYNANIQNPN